MGLVLLYFFNVFKKTVAVILCSATSFYFIHSNIDLTFYIDFLFFYMTFIFYVVNTFMSQFLWVGVLSKHTSVCYLYSLFWFSILCTKQLTSRGFGELHQAMVSTLLKGENSCFFFFFADWNYPCLFSIPNSSLFSMLSWLTKERPSNRLSSVKYNGNLVYLMAALALRYILFSTRADCGTFGAAKQKRALNILDSIIEQICDDD